MPWQFLAFTGVMGGLLYLHFYFAHRCWRRVHGERVEDIDPSYVRREDYFGQSFRTKLQSWLELPATVASDGTRTIQRPHERIRLSPTFRLADRSKSDEVMATPGDFTCGAFSELAREIHAEGNVSIGHGSQAQAIAADGNIALDTGTEVARWVDSWGELRVGRGCVVYSRACARKSIVLELGAEARSVFAPEVIIGTNVSTGKPALPSGEPVHRLQLPPATDAVPEDLVKAGIDPAKFLPLGTECWIYNGSLRPLSAVRIMTHLVVRGDCEIPDGSLIESDLKASRSLSIGAGSECRGNLVAETWLHIGSLVRFTGMIHADEEILMSRGVCGESENGPVAVDAGSWLYAEEGVHVRGKLSSGERVRVVDEAFVQSWRQKHKLGQPGLGTAK